VTLWHHKRKLDQATRTLAVGALNADEISDLTIGSEQLKAGDIVLARVIRSGQPVQLAAGAPRLVEAGEFILCVWAGLSYAEAASATPTVCILTEGGFAMMSHSAFDHAGLAPLIQPIAVVSGRRPGDFVETDAYDTLETLIIEAPVFALVGMADGSGLVDVAKTLIARLREQGQTVGFAQITGANAAATTQAAQDAGACVARVPEIIDAETPKMLEERARNAIADLIQKGASIVLLSLGEAGLEPAWVEALQGDLLWRLVDGYVVAGKDAISLTEGVTALRQHSCVLAIGGSLTADADAQRHAASATGLPVIPSGRAIDAALVHLWLLRFSGSLVRKEL
jgi:hypothetical protein